MEKIEIVKIQREVPWICSVKWEIENSVDLKCYVLTLFVDMLIHGNVYNVKLTYPPLFPDTPIIAAPVEKGARWSNHQYLNGILCLEWGPDNWRSDVTGADMLKSTYKLLDNENPLGRDGKNKAVPSRHFLTDGQINRRKRFRLVLDNEIIERIRDLPISKKIPFTAVNSSCNDSWIYHITKIISSDNTWINEKIPPKFQNDNLFYTKYGIIFHTNVSKEEFSKITSCEELETLIQKVDDENLILNDVKDPETPDIQKLCLLIFVTQEKDIVCLLNVDDKVCNVSVIEDNDHTNRNPSYLTSISSKKVGIVGLGSVGSKVAVSLSRAGINKFYLIDEDLFLSVNIQRHVLDWRNVGEHKVKALERVLKYISPEIQVESEIINLDEQESNKYLNQVLTKLSQCDIIIDCTANPTVLNILSAIYRIYEKSIMWCEVFAGGIGGMIARSRYGKDPAPELMRAAYNNYIIENPDSEYKTIGNYAAEDASGQIITASDADVSVISAHLTRFAIDTIIDSDVSMYPYSLYLIGMSNAWVFNQPLCTIPIATSDIEIEENIPKLNKDELVDITNFITDLVENLNHVHDTDK